MFAIRLYIAYRRPQYFRCSADRARLVIGPAWSWTIRASQSKSAGVPGVEDQLGPVPKNARRLGRSPGRGNGRPPAFAGYRGFAQRVLGRLVSSK
jgi:hypothetical protein